MRHDPKSGKLGGPMAIFGLAALAIGLAVQLLLPEIKIAAWGIIGLGLALLLIALVIDYRRVRTSLTGPRGRFRLGAGVLASIFTGIIIGVNAISIAHYQRWDTSSLAQFTLTPQTINVIKNLPTPVKAIGFCVPNDPNGISGYLKDFLEVYGNYNRQLTVEYVDPDQHPDQAKKYGISEYNTVVFESGERRRLVSPTQFLEVDETGNLAGVKAEYPFTSALLEVTGVAQKKVYFLTGHGESGSEAGISKAWDGLKNDLYTVETLNLAAKPKIPEDCSVLIIAAPRNSLSSNELNVIDGYLKKGGQALLLTDPGSGENIQPIISSWGVDVGKGIVVDQGSSVSPHQDMPLVAAERNYFALPAVYFPGAAAIIPQEKAPDNVQLMPLVYTEPGSWQDKDWQDGRDPVFDAGSEKKDSLAIGVMIVGSPASDSKQNKLTRLVILGDSDFASNEHFDNANNKDLFLNAVSWLAEESSLISIRRNVQPFRRLVVTPSQAGFIKYSSFLLFPVLLSVTAVIIWWRRR